MKALSGPQLLHYFGNGLLFIAAFFGILYWTKGNEIISFLFTTLLWGFNFLCIEWLKEAKITNSSYGRSTKEKSLLVIFSVVSFASSILIVHFVNTELMLKSEIKAEGSRRINALEEMSNSYEKQVDAVLKQRTADLEAKKVNYLENRKPIIDNDIDTRKLTGDKANDKVQLTEQTKRILRDLKIGYEDGLTQLKKRNEELKSDKKAVFDNWNRFHLSDAFNQLDERNAENYKYYRSKLATFDSKKDATLSFSIDSPFKLIKERNPGLPLPILVSVVIFVLILIPYFSAKASNSGSKQRESNIRTAPGHETLFS